MLLIPFRVLETVVNIPSDSINLPIKTIEIPYDLIQHHDDLMNIQSLMLQMNTICRNNTFESIKTSSKRHLSTEISQQK